MKDTENNELLKCIYDLYDTIYDIKKGTITPDITQTRKKDANSLLEFLFDKEDVKSYPDLDKVIRKIENKYDALKMFVPSFETMWEFCEFIRICEKVFFLRNDPNNFVYVEMRLDKPDSTRKICINGNATSGKVSTIETLDLVPRDCEIRFTLERNVYALDIITVTVVRDFGLKMQNTYKIANGDLDYDDSSDMYLINQINSILEHTMSVYFLRIVEQILNEGGFYEYFRDRITI